MKFKITDARLAFPNLFTMSQTNGEGKPSFNCTLLTDPDQKWLYRPDAGGPWKPITPKAAIELVAKDKWPDKYADIIKALRAKDSIVIRKGDDKLNRDGEIVMGFEGKIATSCRSYTKVMVLDKDGTTPLVESDGKPYGGCYVNATVDLWAMDSTQWGRGINCKILAVQFARDGDAFSGGPPPSADDFEALEDAGAGFGDEAEGIAETDDVL